MGPCEQSSEPACTSPRLSVADALGERFVECGMESLSSLDISSRTADGGVDDSVVQFTAQQHCCSDSGGGLSVMEVKDDSVKFNSPLPADGAENYEASVERADLECADVYKQQSCDALDEKLHELVLVPVSDLDISSQAPRGEKDDVLVSCSEEGYRDLDHSSDTLIAKDGNSREICQGFAYTDVDFEPTVDRDEEKCGRSNNNSEFGNVSSIDCRLNEVCFDRGQCDSEIDSGLSNPTDDGLVPSGIKLVADPPSGSSALYISDSIAGGDNHIGGILMEPVSVGTMDNGSLKSVLKLDTLRVNDYVAAPNYTCAVESFNHAGNTGKGKSGTDGDSCELKCPNASSLPLRRSSRSRKSVQLVQREKNATKCTKKASKASFGQTIDFLTEATRKRRSSLSRSISSSVWGMSEHLSKYFQCNNEVAVNLVMEQRSKKKKAGKRSRKKNMLKVVASSQCSEVRQEVPCRPIRLKVTFGKKEETSKVDCTPPVVVDALPNFQSDNDVKQLSICSYIESSEGNVMDISVSKEMSTLLQCSNPTSNVQFAGENLDTFSVKCPRDDSSLVDFEMQEKYADKLSDPGTSPDSEVIDQSLDSTIGPRDLPSQHNCLNKVSCGNSCPKNHSVPASVKKSKNRRNKKDKFCQASNPVLECQHTTDGTKLSKKKAGQLQKLSSNFYPSDNINAETENPLSNTSSSELVSMEELLPVAGEGFDRAPSLDDVAVINTFSRMIIGTGSAHFRNSCELLPPAQTQGMRNSKGSRKKEKSRNKSKIIDSITYQKEPSSQQKDEMNLTSKDKVRESGILGEAYKIRRQLETGNHDVVDGGKTDSSNEVALELASCSDIVLTRPGEQTLAPRVAWVCCDDCLKWRCIPAELADVIEETNCRWTCKDNQDQAFADCSIPQGKSNSEINAELQISDEEDARDGHVGSKSADLRQLVASQPSTWMLIKSNLFLHRNRKAQTVDEVMVCHCKPPLDGRTGCGSQCLNRMLNIECVQGTCPCGDLCSNQQFQKQQYVMLSWFRCGKKGYGLQVLEDISEGQFLIEYVGEVLDLPSYEARQKDYASKGHKHFYFMTLNGNEVIDASTKGNLGRFVNHSCDPNCRTEKWVVNGEICVGLFALRNIKKGEELTFDYNYVRVFGAAVKKCHCGSRKCRGYIGGDPLNAQVIVQGDSDEEFPEPVVVNENGEIDRSLEDKMAKSSSQDVEQALNGDNLNEDSDIIVEAAETINKLNSLIDDVGQSQIVPEKDTVDEVRESTGSSTGLRPENLVTEPTSAIQNHTLKAEPTMSTPTSSPKSDVLRVENTMQKSLSGSTDSSCRVSDNYVECEPTHARQRPRMKISRPSKSVKSRKFSGSSTMVGKAVFTASRSKILSCKPSGHLEAVEEKLNELLDSDGGICKKKDASKGYLKLLLLTAASGDSGNGGAIQSNRDLSMILDAILKTKSRGVLLDIINKNGLQMLHNMMKLYRRDFKKIPILRKLLKVLEFLAEKEILTVERIIEDSLHPGVESLKESVLFFTNHKDNQVHQIARNFRDRWIPYALRRFGRMERSDRRREFRRGSNSNRHFETCHHWREQGATATEHIPSSDQSGTMNNPADVRMQEASSPHLTSSQTIVARPRKRKSRWDQPAHSSSSKKIQTKQNVDAREEEGDCSGSQNISKQRDEVTDNVMQNSDEDAPPGFSYPRDCVDDTPPGFSSSLKCSSVSMGLFQERFNPRSPVAYGIPFSVIRQFGTLECGNVDSWAIAPAMPFQPFPPLPSYPRDSRQIGNQEETRQDYHSCPAEERDQGVPSTSEASASQAQNTAAKNQNMLHHERGPWSFPGKRYYRQKKWNKRPPWFRNVGGWGFKGNYPPHPRNGTFEMNMETAANDLNGQHLADVYHSVEYAGNSC